MWRSTSDAVRPLGEQGESEVEGVHKRVGGWVIVKDYSTEIKVIFIQGPRIHSSAPVGLLLKFDLLCFPSWHAIIVDGHSVEELCKVLSQPRHQPLAIIAKTIKGKGIPGTIISHTHSDLQYVRLIISVVLSCSVYSFSKVLTCCVSFFIKKMVCYSIIPT